MERGKKLFINNKILHFLSIRLNTIFRITNFTVFVFQIPVHGVFELRNTNTFSVTGASIILIAIINSEIMYSLDWNKE